MSDAVSALRGRRILVAEDEYMIAQEIVGVLAAAGAEIIGPVPRLAAAAELIALGEPIDGALLDVNLGSEAIWPVVDALLERHVPMVLATGYDASAIPAAYAGLSRCEKPAAGQDLADALARLLDRPQGTAGSADR